MVKFETVVVQVLGDAIHLELAVMNHHHGITTSHGVVIIARYLFGAHRSLADTDADLHLAGGCVRLLPTNILKNR